LWFGCAQISLSKSSIAKRRWFGWAPAAWRDARGGLVHSDDPELLGRLARRLGFDSGALRSAWWQHFDYLRAQYASGRRGGVAMREAVLAFYSEAAVGRL